MIADRRRRGGLGHGAGEVEGGLSGAPPEAGAGAAGEHVTLDADDGADQGGPLGADGGRGGIEDGDAALLLPVAPLITAADIGGTAVAQRAFAC